jgi:DNA-directed RNA polymerase specialized sigma24 family protein
VLCVVEEVPGKDAAEALGIREASLYRRLSDAREALRAAIEELQR